MAIVRNGESVESAAAGEDVEVVLDRTPFYAEMGGQQGDAGELSAEGVLLTVSDTKNHNGLYAHVAHVAEGTLTVGATVTAALDAERRGFLRRNHTATHLLDAALKHVLGEHVSQAGSLVTPEHLRFDFTHFEALSSEQLKAVEDLVNQQIFASKPVVTRVMGIDEAKAAGAVACLARSMATSSASFPWAPRPAVLPRALRWYACCQHCRDRPIQDYLRVLHGLERPPYRGRYL